MIQASDLPAWAGLLVAILVLAGAAMTLIGAMGLLRLGTFYERVPPRETRTDAAPRPTG